MRKQVPKVSIPVIGMTTAKQNKKYSVPTYVLRLTSEQLHVTQSQSANVIFKGNERSFYVGCEAVGVLTWQLAVTYTE